MCSVTNFMGGPSKIILGRDLISLEVKSITSGLRGLKFITFVRFALVWFCLFPLPLGVWEGLRLVIAALPGLFSFLFYFHKDSSQNISRSGLLTRSKLEFMYTIKPLQWCTEKKTFL